MNRKLSAARKQRLEKQQLRMANVEPVYLGVRDAEQMTSISRWTWRLYCQLGKVEYSKVGGRVLIPLAEVRRLLAEGTRPRVRDEPAGALDSPRAQQKY